MGQNRRRTYHPCVQLLGGRRRSRFGRREQPQHRHQQQQQPPLRGNIPHPLVKKSRNHDDRLILRGSDNDPDTRIHGGGNKNKKMKYKNTHTTKGEKSTSLLSANAWSTLKSRWCGWWRRRPSEQFYSPSQIKIQIQNISTHNLHLCAPKS